MKIDFNKLKTDISMPDLLISLGWKFVSGSSNSSPKMSNGTQTIVIKKNRVGQYTYWDVHSDNIRGKTVIDLMQQHIFDQTGKMPTLREAAERLQIFIDSNEITLPQNSKFEVSGGGLDESQLGFINNQLRTYSGDFLEKRGISKETLSSAVFSDVFFSRHFKHNGKLYNNTCVRLINQEGFQGISQRGYREEDNKSFKGIMGNKFGSIAVSRHDSTRPIEQLFIGESILDGAAHYQMKYLDSPKNLLYVSTEGNLTQGQMELIKLLIDKQKINNITTIFDNDRIGYKYSLKLYGFLNGEQIPDLEELDLKTLKNMVVNLNTADLPVTKDWNDDLKHSLAEKLGAEQHKDLNLTL